MYLTITDGILTMDTLAITSTVGTTLTSDTALTGTVHTVGITGIGIIVLLFIIAHLLDRKYSRPMYGQESMSTEDEEATKT